MHADELPIDDAVVRRLVDEQFPEWANLALTRVEPWGTVNAIYRLGDELSVRLPRLVRWSDVERRVARWLPRFAADLPVSVPEPVAQGVPAPGYPCHWSVCTWVDGDTGIDAPWDPLPAAETLAGLVAVLRALDPQGAPALRDRLSYRDDEMRARVTLLGERAVAVWEAALAAPAWDGPPVWCHGDLDARNWLVRERRIVGVIAWESFGVGDPSADVMAAWKLHTAEAAHVFRETLGIDDVTWARARGWAVSQAASALDYYTMENNAPLVVEAQRWLALLLDND